MTKQRDEVCASVKTQYPAISSKADKEYARLWEGFTDSEYYSYPWFQWAHALNNEMSRGVPEAGYRELFSTISDAFKTGDQDVQKAIDVAFVENLFWQVPADKAAGYWAALPEKLKRLCVDFHHRTPLYPAAEPDAGKRCVTSRAAFLAVRVSGSSGLNKEEEWKLIVWSHNYSCRGLR